MLLEAGLNWPEFTGNEAQVPTSSECAPILREEAASEARPRRDSCLLLRIASCCTAAAIVGAAAATALSRGSRFQREHPEDVGGDATILAASTVRRPVAPVSPPANRQRLEWYDADQAGLHNQHITPDRGARLLGKTLRATVDVSQVGCGCVAGFFLYDGYEPYCDASGTWPGKVERCGEIDLFEGNKFAWHSTLHNRMDHPGLFGGFGGMQQPDMTYGQGPRDMTGAQYGPGGSIIDTERPFHAAISFPRGANGSLADLVVMLYQDGKDQAIEWRVNKGRSTAYMDCTLEDCHFCFSKPGCIYREADLQLFGQMLHGGMTMQSTWWGTDQPWLDGTLDEEEGGCKIHPGQPNTEKLGAYNVPYKQCGGAYKVTNWTLEEIQDPGRGWGDIFNLMDQQPLVSAA
jgi:hypothetical protein